MKIFKVASKLFVLIALFFLILCAVFCIYAARITRGAKLDRQKLDTPTKEIVFYDANEQIIETTFLSAREKCTLDEIPQSVKNAFIAIEDKRFYSHDGIDYRRVIAAAINNVKAHSYLEGASTISQQLIKNTHLNSQKTIKRKLTEMKLAKKLEKAYSKDEILTMYLNTIYFGENCYGIKAASQRFFKKKPKELTNAEAATLAAVIKAPSIYSPIRHAQKCEERRNLVLSEMFRQQFISEDQYKEAISVALEVEKEEKAFASDYLKEVLAETEKILRFPLLSYGNSLQIYTGLDPSLQKIVEELDYDAPHNSLFSGMITDSRTALIAAFRSDCGQASRQAGSTLKPLLVYAPAIEYDVIDEATLILDEKTDFSGYVPHNYANKYYGYVSAKEALAKSLNVPAVKTLNAVGIFKSIKIGKKFGLSLTERDDSLVLALGATSGGIT